MPGEARADRPVIFATVDASIEVTVYFEAVVTRSLAGSIVRRTPSARLNGAAGLTAEVARRRCARGA
jgi:hypothetical protein